MNLRELKSVTYALLGDPSQQGVNFGIVVGYINIAQTILGNMLWDVDREKFLATDAQNGTNGTADYSTPSDLRQIVRVVLNDREMTRLPVTDLNAIKENTLYRGAYPNQMWYNEMEGTAPGKTRIRLYPTPITGAGAGTNNLVIWYYRRPVSFHVNGTYEGAATSNGTTTTIIDTAAPYNTTATTYTDFWKNASVRMTSGSNNGIIRRVSSQTVGSSTFTLDTALPTATASADTYEIDQESILPEYVHYLMPYYAAALAAPQLNKDGSRFMEYWEKELEMMKNRLIANVKINTPGEVPMGVHTARS